MAKYLFLYHGGENPKSDEEAAEVMDAWGNWLGSMGSAVVDGGTRWASRARCTPTAR